MKMHNCRGDPIHVSAKVEPLVCMQHCYWAVSKLLVFICVYRFPQALLGIIWIVVAFFLILSMTITLGLVIERSGSKLPVRLPQICECNFITK